MPQLSEENKEIAESKPYQYFEQGVSRRIHHFYLSQSIEGPEHYIDMIHRIATATSDDIIHIHYKNIRIEMSIPEFSKFRELMTNTEILKQNSQN